MSAHSNMLFGIRMMLNANYEYDKFAADDNYITASNKFWDPVAKVLGVPTDEVLRWYWTCLVPEEYKPILERLMGQNGKILAKMMLASRRSCDATS